MTLDAPLITRDGDRYHLEYSEVYATDIDDLWSAVTTAERLSRWMATSRGDLREGGEWEVLGSDGEVWCRGVCDRFLPLLPPAKRSFMNHLRLTV